MKIIRIFFLSIILSLFFTSAHSTCPFTITVSSNSPVCEGATLNLYCSVNSAEPMTFLWAGPNSFSSSVQNPTINNVSIAQQQGQYSVTVTSNGCSETGSLNVIINPIPNIVIYCSPATICQNSQSNLYCTSTIPATTFCWSGGLGCGTTSNNWYVSPSTTTSYPVTATANGCSASKSITVTVRPLPGINYFVYPSCKNKYYDAVDGKIKPISGCAQLGYIDATAISNGGAGGPYDFAWSTGKTNLSAPQSGIKDLCPGSYMITVTDNGGCVGTYSIKVDSLTTPGKITADTISGGLNHQFVFNWTGAKILPVTKWMIDEVEANHNIMSKDTSIQFTSLGQHQIQLITISGPQNCIDTASITISVVTPIMAPDPPAPDVHCSFNADNNMLSIQVDNSNNAECSLNIYNIFGRKSMPQFSFRSTAVMDVSMLNKGLYVVKVNGYNISKKLKFLR